MRARGFPKYFPRTVEKLICLTRVRLSLLFRAQTGQNLTGLPQKTGTNDDKAIASPRSLTLVVLLSGPRTGTEWLAKVMADDSQLVCGSIDDRTAPHPESLMPYDVECNNRTQIPCSPGMSSVQRMTRATCG